MVCSSTIPDGYVILLEKVPGVPLSNQLWQRISQEAREQVEMKLRSAVGLLRRIGKVHGDPSMQNVLYDEESSLVTMVDFEHVLPNDYGCGIDDGPELYSILPLDGAQ